MSTSSSCPTRVFLFCGYRRWGKNTAAEHLQSKQKTFSYDVYARQSTLIGSLKLSSRRRPVEASFAKALKTDVGQLFGLTWEEIDQQKERELTIEEHTIYAPFWTGAPGNTIREVLIDRAASIRAKDFNYYVKQVMTFEYDPETDLVITDWRYPNEAEYILSQGCRVVTVRVLRSGVPIPPSTDYSEHQLDDYRTDYIMTPVGDSALVPESYLPYKYLFIA